MGNYIHILNCRSRTNGSKKYKISVDVNRTLETERLDLSCNCPDYVTRRKKYNGKCKHLTETWTHIENYALTNFGKEFYTNNGEKIEISFEDCLSGFWDFEVSINMVIEKSRDALSKSETFQGQLLPNLLGRDLIPIGMGYFGWKLGMPCQKHFLSNRIRICGGCYHPQEIPLDTLLFSCEICGRSQRT